MSRGVEGGERAPPRYICNEVTAHWFPRRRKVPYLKDCEEAWLPRQQRKREKKKKKKRGGDLPRTCQGCKLRMLNNSKHGENQSRFKRRKKNRRTAAEKEQSIQEASHQQHGERERNGGGGTRKCGTSRRSSRGKRGKKAGLTDREVKGAVMSDRAVMQAMLLWVVPFAKSRTPITQHRGEKKKEWGLGSGREKKG